MNLNFYHRLVVIIACSELVKAQFNPLATPSGCSDYTSTETRCGEYGANVGGLSWTLCSSPAYIIRIDYGYSTANGGYISQLRFRCSDGYQSGWFGNGDGSTTAYTGVTNNTGIKYIYVKSDNSYFRGFQYPGMTTLAGAATGSDDHARKNLSGGTPFCSSFD